MGSEYPVWRSATYDTSGAVTEETLRQAYEMMLKQTGRPDVEYHNPRCPKWTSHGKLACRCGAAPLEAIIEAIIEDELNRG